MRKYIYNIPVVVKSLEASLKINITVLALHKRQAIAIAQKLGRKKFCARFPSQRINKIEIDAEKIEVKGSREVKQAVKKRRDPQLPFSKNKKIEYLPDIVYYLGSQIVKHKVIVFDDWLKLFLLESEKPKIYKDRETDRERLIIVDKRKRYVKVLVHNEEDMPVLMRIEPDSKKKFKSEIEFLEGFGYSPWIPKSEYKEAIKIASRILKGGVK